MIELNSNQKGYDQIIKTIKEGFTQFFYDESYIVDIKIYKKPDCFIIFLKQCDMTRFDYWEFGDLEEWYKEQFNGVFVRLDKRDRNKLVFRLYTEDVCYINELDEMEFKAWCRDNYGQDFANKFYFDDGECINADTGEVIGRDLLLQRIPCVEAAQLIQDAL